MNVYCTHVDSFNDMILFHSNESVINSSGIVLYDSLGLNKESSIIETPRSGFTSGTEADLIRFILNNSYDLQIKESLSSSFVSATEDELICFVLNNRYDFRTKKSENSEYFDLYYYDDKDEVEFNMYGEDFSIFLCNNPQIVEGISLLAHEVLLYEEGKSVNDKYVEYLCKEDCFQIPSAKAEFRDVYIKDDDGVHLATTYKFDSFADFFYFYLSLLVRNKITLKICKNCGKYFVTKRSNSINCSNASPQDNRKSCRKYVNDQAGAETKRTDEGQKLYKQITSLLAERSKRADGNYAILNKLKDFRDEAKKWRERVADNKVPESDYIEWLKKEKKGFKK